MIGRLRGTLAVRQPPSLLVDVGGVGYEVEAPLSTFASLPETGATVTILTHLVVREDAHILYGFASERERALFRNLIRVSGVGAKMALAVLSGMSADEFARCVQAGDIARLTRLPGVGKKTAERLVVEMRDRLPALPGVAGLHGMAAPNDARSDAVEALIALGYKPPEAARMIESIKDHEKASSEDLIRRALKGAMK